jgi:hypothetical protein
MNRPDSSFLPARDMPAGEERPSESRAARMHTIKVAVPDYVARQLRTRALEQGCTVRHVVMRALREAGVVIHETDLAPDGRRLRGPRARD